MNIKPELAIALDLPSSDNIPVIVKQMPKEIIWYKIGLELFTSEGPRSFEYLLSNNKKVFLDLKLHDIPNTVSRSVTAAARHGISMLTVHASGGRAMLKAAAEAAGEFGAIAPKLVAVTTLTSLDKHDFHDLGLERSISEQAKVLGGMAIASGIDGIVTSVQEVMSLRETFGHSVLMVTPGIRLADSDTGDQKRISTPEEAVRAGSDFLVVGRPILQAKDPRATAELILHQMKIQ